MSAATSLPSELESVPAEVLATELEAVARVLRSAGMSHYPYGIAPIVERIIGERDRARSEVLRLQHVIDDLEDE